MKVEILNGISFNEEVEIEFNGKEHTLTLRPISTEEYGNIEAKLNKGQKRFYDPSMASKQFLDLEQATHRGNQYHVDIFIAGVVAEGLTEKQVKQLPVGFVRKVSNKILEISGLNVEEDKKGKDTKN